VEDGKISKPDGLRRKNIEFAKRDLPLQRLKNETGKNGANAD